MKLRFILCVLYFLFVFSNAEMTADEKYCPSAEFQEKANMSDPNIYSKANADIESFWAECADSIDWYQKWDRILEWDKPFAKWFGAGKLNISYNCLDRHIKAGKGEKVALFWLNERGHQQTVTYQQLYQEVNKLANVLKDFGIQKGDRVAICMPMVPEAIASMLACTRIGAVHSVIFGGIGAQSVRDRILDAEAKLLITADGSYRAGKEIPYKSSIDTILDQCPSIEKTLVLQHIDSPVEMKSGRDYWYADQMAKAAEYCEPEPMDSEDLLFILYTSGTTGKPKGIFHTTAGYLVGAHTTFNWVFDIKPEDVYWSTADIGWITGHSFVVYGPLSNATTQVVYEGAFDYPAKNQFAKIIDDYKVSIFYTAPTLIRMFMKWGDECLAGGDFKSLRLLGSIGEPINPESWLWYYRNIGLGKCPIVDTWFQTETGALVISPLPGITPLVPGTVTRALPGYDVAVLDEEGRPASKGFLAIRRPYPSMMRGIYKDPERYVATYWSKWNGDYYFAGDIATCDEDGYFWIGGRCDEVLKVAGHRIGTAEIENALIEHPKVSESAVFGVKDDLKGERIIAFVILKDEFQMEPGIENQLRQTVATYLGSYAAPQHVMIVNKLPKTRSGKILRRLLKDLVEGRDMGDVSTLNDPSCLDELVEKCRILNKIIYPKMSKEISLNLIAPTPEFKDLDLAPVGLGREELCKILTPFLEQHLQETNYDRLHLLEQFLDYYQECLLSSAGIKPIEALETFIPDLSLEKHRGGSCYGLTDDLISRLPKNIQACRIPAILLKRFQQKGWSNYSHSAALICYESPFNSRDQGYILLDPNFDIEIPIVLLRDGTPAEIDMKDKGIWTFRVKEKRIICSDLQGNEMYYELKEYLNAPKAALKTMIAADRRISFVSRDQKGVHLGHINVNLDLKRVDWAIGYKKQDSFFFDEMMTGQREFNSDFAGLLHMTADDLNNLLRKIIRNQDVLNQLKEGYFDLLKDSSRPEDFIL